MRCRWNVLVAALLMLSAARPVTADNWLTKACASFARDFRRNNCWPEPFTTPDRSAVRAPFCIMVANGWRLQNTLSDHHFDPDTHRLNEAGQLKVQSILIDSPADFQTVFVLIGVRADITAVRMITTQEYVARIAGPGIPPAVVETAIRPRSAPADYLDGVNRRFLATSPDPRLPPSSGGSATAGSSGSGAGS